MDVDNSEAIGIVARSGTSDLLRHSVEDPPRRAMTLVDRCLKVAR
jgi:hypothetical protein